MKTAVALILLSLAVASAQTYGGVNYKYNANIMKQVDGDIQQTTGIFHATPPETDCKALLFVTCSAHRHIQYSP